MESLDKKPPIPPYVAYRTFSTFLSRFSQGLPGRIDRGLMASMSGAAQSQVSTALKYLGFISENGIPTDTMRQYVLGEEEKRSAVLRLILEKAYPFVFGDGAPFDFATATSSQLREEFESKTSATGETVARCIAFLKDAAQDAGITISPYITQKKTRSSTSRRRPVAPKNGETGDVGKGKPKDQGSTLNYSQQNPPAPIPAQESLLLWGLFKKLPKPGTSWPAEDRTQWMQTLSNVLALEYKD